MSGEAWCKVQKISGAGFQESSPTVVTHTHTEPSPGTNCDNICEMWSTMEAF